MINNRTIALAIVDTQQHILAANALYNSISDIEFDQVLIYSNNDSFWGGYEKNANKKHCC